MLTIRPPASIEGYMGACKQAATSIYKVTSYHLRSLCTDDATNCCTTTALTLILIVHHDWHRHEQLIICRENDQPFSRSKFKRILINASVNLRSTIRLRLSNIGGKLQNLQNGAIKRGKIEFLSSKFFSSLILPV